MEEINDFLDDLASDFEESFSLDESEEDGSGKIILLYCFGVFCICFSSENNPQKATHIHSSCNIH